MQFNLRFSPRSSGGTIVSSQQNSWLRCGECDYFVFPADALQPEVKQEIYEKSRTDSILGRS